VEGGALVSRNLALAAFAVAKRVELTGASPLVVRLSRLVVYAMGRDALHVSTATLRARARLWGILGRYGAPSYGAMVDVLERLRALGYIDWERAHVPRHHGVLPFAERPRLYPRRTACGEPRLPARKLTVEPALAALLGIAARPIAARATLIERSSPPPSAGAATPPKGVSERRPGIESVPASPIEPAPEAEPIVPRRWVERSESYTPDDGRAWLERMRRLVRDD